MITSGLGRIPAGIPVGHVSRIIDKDQGLFQKLEVRPAVSYSTLETVLIVLAPPPVRAPGKSNRTLRPVPAYGTTPL